MNKEVIEYIERRIISLKTGNSETQEFMHNTELSTEEWNECSVDVEINKKIISELSVVLEKLK